MDGILKCFAAIVYDEHDKKKSGGGAFVDLGYTLLEHDNDEAGGAFVVLTKDEFVSVFVEEFTNDFSDEVDERRKPDFVFPDEVVDSCPHCDFCDYNRDGCDSCCFCGGSGDRSAGCDCD